MCWEYMVALDIGGIHEYIFGTNKLKEIRGASILLDILNRELPDQELKSGRYGVEGKDWKAVITAGGNIKILFRDNAKAEGFKNYLSGLFKERAPGAKFTVIVGERQGLSEEKWLKKIEKELQRGKSLSREKRQILTSSYFKTCDACGLYPAEIPDHPRERYLCKACYRKIEGSKTYKEVEIYKELEKSKGNLKLPDECNEIGKNSEPEVNMGF